MDPQAGYDVVPEEHYYTQVRPAHGSSRVGRGQVAGKHAYYPMAPGVIGGYDPMQGAAMMQGHGTALDGSFDSATLGHGYGGMATVGASHGVMQRQHGLESQYPGDAGMFPDPPDPDTTPKTGRVSRAKKGKPVHYCETCVPRRVSLFLVPACVIDAASVLTKDQIFTRAEHLR